MPGARSGAVGRGPKRKRGHSRHQPEARARAFPIGGFEMADTNKGRNPAENQPNAGGARANTGQHPNPYGSTGGVTGANPLPGDRGGERSGGVMDTARDAAHAVADR